MVADTSLAAAAAHRQIRDHGPLVDLELDPAIAQYARTGLVQRRRGLYAALNPAGTSVLNSAP
ncbi:hypothetical protein GCM10010341_58310 [Streptomyces noursei]|nr:hypothetical protein GCM10010341_58310 [Streptomyces noursei]